MNRHREFPARLGANPPRSGVTLAELLVVMAVLAALAALLMPVINGALATSRKAVCAQNLKTHHHGIVTYSNDHNGEIVYASIAGQDIWQGILVKGGYLPEAKKGANYIPHGLRCPANPAGYQPGIKSPGGELRFKYGTPNYLYNILAGTPVSVDRPRLPQLVSSGKALLFEGGEVRTWGTPFRCNYALQPNTLSFDPKNPNYAIGDVHNGGSHVLFWDGHVETFAEGMIDPRIAQWMTP